MKQELWLSRNDDLWHEYIIHDEEPEKDSGQYEDGIIDELCPKLFHKYVQGARLRKGRKREIKRILIELED